jgi:hypothetical protein
MPAKSAILELETHKPRPEEPEVLREDRIRRRTSRKVLHRIDEETRSSIRLHAGLGKEAVSRRLQELEREWPVDRGLIAVAGVNLLIGLSLGRWVDRRWFLFPAVVGSFLVQYAFGGWCPPLSVLRRLGFRSHREIELERNALKALRGDYDHISEAEPDQDVRVEKAIESAR